LAAKCLSRETLNVSTRCGFSPCACQITQQRAKPLRYRFQRAARQLQSTHVHIAVDVANAQAHQTFGTASFELPGQEVSSLPQERVDAGPGKATLLAKPGLVFIADRKSQCIGGAGRFRGWWPLPLHKPKQCVNARARNLVPARTRTPTTTLPEQGDRIAQILFHSGFGDIRDQDISPRKMVEKPARISAIVPYHHRAVLLTGQYDLELGDQFAIGFRHQ
jgi:hypothetical protein